MGFKSSKQVESVNLGHLPTSTLSEFLTQYTEVEL